MVFRFSNPDKLTMPAPSKVLAGRAASMPVSPAHVVLGTPVQGPWPEGLEVLVVGMGCFWGVERLFWTIDGVYNTAAGYAGGGTPNPTYEEVCSGRTGHTEVVQVVYDPAKVSVDTLLKTFWEEHDPTQGMRQGNDVGTQYRSAIFWTTAAQQTAAEASRDTFQGRLTAVGLGAITTELAPLDAFFYAEDYHQQYLSDAKNPHGYCGLKGTGVSCPVGVVG